MFSSDLDLHIANTFFFIFTLVLTFLININEQIGDQNILTDDDNNNVYLIKCPYWQGPLKSAVW